MDKSLKHIYNQIIQFANSFDAKKLVLFGSRARGDERERSDIDIAVFGMPEKKQSSFLNLIDELDTLLDFDIVFISEKTSPELLSNIRKDGVILMDKMNEKYSKLIEAVNRLDESIKDYEKLHLDSIRDGAIQRFEFCTELAWKTIREYLIDQGYTEINSPKAVMKTAFSDGIINNENIWIDLLNSRNITSHLYDEESAKAIYQKISTSYFQLFKTLIDALKN